MDKIIKLGVIYIPITHIVSEGSAQMNRLFDPIKSQVTQYLVCPHDYFALGSMELLDHDAYIYRLLRADGYERVIFIEIENTKCVAHTFDAFSQYSYHHTNAFEAATFSPDPRKRQDDIDRFLAQFSGSAPIAEPESAQPRRRLLRGSAPTAVPAPAAASISPFGKRVIMDSSGGNNNEATFSSHFLKYIRPALETQQSRTAVVIPMILFEKSGFLSEQVTDILYNINRNYNQRNLLLLTAERQEELSNCFNDHNNRNSRLHDWVNEADAISEDMSEGDKAARALDVLRNQQRIVIADQAGADEIANLLFRHILIEKMSKIIDIPLNKVYHLASLLWEDLTGKTKDKPHFRHARQNNETIIKSLDTMVRHRYPLIDEILTMLPKIKERNFKPVAYHRELRQAVHLDRIAIPSLPGKDNQRYMTSINLKAPRPYEVSEAERNEISKELNEMIGLENVKQRVRELAQFARKGKARAPGHYMFVGNPGTGKTVVARLMGEIFHAYGLLSKGHLVEAKKADLVAGYIGQTAIKTREVCERALGGVLLVDEAHQLVNTEGYQSENYSDSFSQDAYNEIMTFMENNRDNICVIFTGYKDKMQQFVAADPGMESRKPEEIYFPDYSETELFQILELYAKKGGYIMSEEYATRSKQYIRYLYQRKNERFGNARTIREEIYNPSVTRVNQRDDRQNELLEEDAPKVPEFNEAAFQQAMSELNKMAGLEPIKNKIHELLVNCKHCQRRGNYELLKGGPGSYIFTGNPGTGKTHVATMMLKIFKALGVLTYTGDKPITVKASELTASSVEEIRKLCEQALGGVLIVDEAYTLVNTHPNMPPFPSKHYEQIYTELMTFLYENKANICVIFAGYQREMEFFIKANSGMNRRVQVVHFPDYSAAQLVEILCKAIREKGFDVTAGFQERATAAVSFMLSHKTGDFGNAGYMYDQYCVECISRHNARAHDLEENGELVPDILTEDDVPDTWQNQKIIFETNTPTAPVYRKLPRELFLSISQAVRPSADKISLKEATENAILYITTENGCGTGFLIHGDGYALTCNHVIENATQINARMRIEGRWGGRDSFHKCQVVNVRKDIDIALLKLEGSDFPHVPLAPADFHPDCFHPFILPGYPFGEETAGDLTVYDGKTASSDRQTDDLGIDKIFISGEAKRGNSGSPLISELHGFVMGLLVGSIRRESEEINYYRPIHYFWREFLK